MSSKTKSKNLTSDTFSELSQNVGIILMTAATTLGMVELPNHLNGKVVVPNQPAMAFASDQGNNPLRREKEDAGPHYVSYSIAQRTPGRTKHI